MHRAEFAWTPELVERLIAAWNDGASAAEVQIRIGAPSRSAVIGKVHRLRRDGVTLRGLKRTASSVSVKVAAAAPQIGDDNVLAKPEPGAVHFLDAIHGQCHWPLWDCDDEPKYVCGAAAEPGCSYCYAHRRIAYVSRRATRHSEGQAGFEASHSAIPMRNRIIRPVLKRAVAETARRDRFPAGRRGSGS